MATPTLAAVGAATLAVKAVPVLKDLVIALGTGAAEVAGSIAGVKASERVRDYLSWRPAADEDSLRDQLVSFGLSSAESFLALADNSADPTTKLVHLKSALDELVRAQDRLQQADVQSDEKMWRHQVHVWHLLVFVAYLHESCMGQNHAAGLGAVRIFLPQMFALFADKMDWARRAHFYKERKQQQVIEDYEQHMTIWEHQLLALQRVAGASTVRLTRENSTRMVREVEIILPPAAAVAAPALPPPVLPPVCTRCGIGGMVAGGGCSNPACAAACSPPATLEPEPEPEPEVASSHAPRWEWREDHGGWSAYQPHICAQLEAALQRSERSVDVDSDRFVDLKKMRQAPWSDPRRTRSVRRCAVQLPPAADVGGAAAWQVDGAVSPPALAVDAGEVTRLQRRVAEKEATLAFLRQDGLQTAALERELAECQAALLAAQQPQPQPQAGGGLMASAPPPVEMPGAGAPPAFRLERGMALAMGGNDITCEHATIEEAKERA
jgi:hypothetical protein